MKKIVAPIHSYIGGTTCLAVNQDLQKGEMYLIISVEEGEVTDVDYGYKDEKQAVAIASDGEAEVITPKNQWVS